MTLLKNMLIQWKGENPRVERILHLDPVEGQAVTYVLALNGEKPRGLPQRCRSDELEAALRTGAASIIREDPYGILQETSGEHPTAEVPKRSMLLKEDEIAEKHRKKREDVWDVLGPHLKDEAILDRIKRGKIIQTLMKWCGNKRENRRGWTKPTCYKYLHRWWQAGQVKNAFLPHYDLCGGKGKARIRPETEQRYKLGPKRGRPSKVTLAIGTPTGVNVTTQMRDQLKQGFKQIFKERKKISFAEAFQLVIERFFTTGTFKLQKRGFAPILLPPEKRPTLAQARYWYKKDQGWIHGLRARKGEREWNLKCRALIGDSTRMAFGPGSLFQIDATIADVYLVSQFDRNRIIGRPVIYIVIDVFSRLIVGFYVGLEGPSWVGALLALRNAVADKTEYCKTLGIKTPIYETEWPSHYLPEAILADRGEFAGYSSDDLVNSLNIVIHNTAPYRADWKGIIERQFRLINDRGVAWLPGAVYAPRQRGHHDYRLDAVLNLPEFRQIMFWYIYEHNNARRIMNYPFDEFMVQDHVEPYPVNLWEWGVRNRTGCLRELPPEVIQPNLLPSAEASLTPHGIKFRDLYYTCSLAIEEQWFEQARIRGRRKVRIAYDPPDTSVLYVRLEAGRRLVPCELLTRSTTYAHRHWDDVEDHFALRCQAAQQARPKEQEDLAYIHAQREQIEKRAKTDKARVHAPQSKRSRLKNVRSNRVSEKEYERTGKRPSDTTGVRLGIPADVPDASDTTYVPRPDQYDKFRKHQNKRWKDGNAKS